MCSSHQHSDQQATDHVDPANALMFRVADMTCGHCEGTIEKAIKSVLPGVKVSADANSRIVSVEGTTDFSKLREIVSAAGYTPSETPVHA